MTFFCQFWLWDMCSHVILLCSGERINNPNRLVDGNKAQMTSQIGYSFYFQLAHTVLLIAQPHFSIFNFISIECNCVLFVFHFIEWNEQVALIDTCQSFQKNCYFITFHCEWVCSIRKYIEPGEWSEDDILIRDVQRFEVACDGNSIKQKEIKATI